MKILTDNMGRMWMYIISVKLAHQVFCILNVTSERIVNPYCNCKSITYVIQLPL